MRLVRPYALTREAATYAITKEVGPAPGTPAGGAYLSFRHVPAEKLREAVKSAGRFPVVGLGGINRRNFPQALRAGAKGVAAIRLFNDRQRLPDIAKKIRDFAGKIDEK